VKTLIQNFDERFAALHRRSCELLKLVPPDKLYYQPDYADKLMPMNSCGEHLLRSGGAVEQTANGMTTKLWDDPFEWTLPENLSTGEKVLEYLGEVEAARVRAFSLLQDDSDLYREIPAPEKLKNIHTLLLDTLARAEHLQGRAFATFTLFSKAKLPRI
jgi:hypothetical protein